MNHYTVDCLDLCKSAGINCVQIKNYQDKLMHYDLHVYAFSMTEVGSLVCTKWQLKYSYQKFIILIHTTIFKPFRACDNYFCGADIFSFVNH